MNCLIKSLFSHILFFLLILEFASISHIVHRFNSLQLMMLQISSSICPCYGNFVYPKTHSVEILSYNMVRLLICP